MLGEWTGECGSWNHGAIDGNGEGRRTGWAPLPHVVRDVPVIPDAAMLLDWGDEDDDYLNDTGCWWRDIGGEG